MNVCTHDLCMFSIVDGYLSCFQFWAKINDAAVNLHFGGHKFAFLLDVYQEEGLLSLGLCIYVSVQFQHIQLSRVVMSGYCPPQGVLAFYLLITHCLLVNAWYGQPFNLVTLMNVPLDLVVVLVCFSLMNRGGEHLSFVHWLFGYPLCFQSFAH